MKQLIFKAVSWPAPGRAICRRAPNGAWDHRRPMKTLIYHGRTGKTRKLGAKFLKPSETLIPIGQMSKLVGIVTTPSNHSLPRKIMPKRKRFRGHGSGTTEPSFPLEDKHNEKAPGERRRALMMDKDMELPRFAFPVNMNVSRVPELCPRARSAF